MIALIFSLLLGGHSLAQEKLLDKIVGVINTKVISLSEIERIKTSLDARREVSPQIYLDKKYTDSQMIDLIIRNFIVKDKINAQGYVINDDAVESRIKMTEERLGLRRSDLMDFLKSKNLTFEEYFELIREAMEYNIFATRIIAPLVSVTEQEVKNEFYKRYSSESALSFKYTLVDYHLPTSPQLKSRAEEFLNVVKDYQLTGKVPFEYKDLATFKLENIAEDGVAPELAETLKSTPEGSFTAPVEINGSLHIFYVQIKDMMESQKFQKFKDQLQNEIFMQKGQAITDSWFDREYPNYYIKTNL